MDGLTLQVVSRKILGKKTKMLRCQGITPVHLFGHNIKSLALQCDSGKLQRIIAQAGTTRLVTLEIEGDKHPRSVFIREIQREPVSGRLLHVDFYQVRKAEKIKAEVPLVLVGKAPAMQLKGCIMDQALNMLSVECLPDKVPSRIEVDISSLAELDQAIYVGDLTLGPGISVINAPEQMIVKVSEVAVRAEEVVVATAAEEVAVGAEVAEAKPEEEAKGEAKPD